MNYYNEFDKAAAEWLRELIREGLIPAGDVDERSIKDVRATDLSGYTGCHFFAGIGGWPYALRLAGWPDDRPVWTGSCPCQPFSAAGKGLGEADERHLWPVFRDLIADGKPAAVLGEQVASKAGRQWLAGVRADLERLGYAVGAADLCSAGVGAPNIRQRIYWMAYAGRAGNECRMRSEKALGEVGEVEREARKWERCGDDVRCGGDHCGLGDTIKPGLEGHSRYVRDWYESGRNRADAVGPIAEAGSSGRLGDTEGGGCGERGDAARSWRGGYAVFPGWSRFDIIPCRDGKARRVEPGTFPLAHGVPGRVGLLRGYGNAINPVLAAEFILAAEEARIEAMVEAV